MRERTVLLSCDGPPPATDVVAVLSQPVPTRLLVDVYTGFDGVTFDPGRGWWGLGTTARGGGVGLMRSGEGRCWYPAQEVFVSSSLG